MEDLVFTQYARLCDRVSKYNSNILSTHEYHLKYIINEYLRTLHISPININYKANITIVLDLDLTLVMSTSFPRIQFEYSGDLILSIPALGEICMIHMAKIGSRDLPTEYIGYIVSISQNIAKIKLLINNEDKYTNISIDEYNIYHKKITSKLSGNIKKIEIHNDIYYVHARPNIDLFIKWLSTFHNVILWSAAEEEYIKKCLDTIGLKPSVIYDRRTCTISGSIISKDVQSIGHDNSNTIIIDDNFNCNANNKHAHHIVIKTYNGGINDTSLLDVISAAEKYIELINKS